MYLLANISYLTETHNLKNSHLTIYIDNVQVIDHSQLPKQGTGPTAFLMEDYNILEGIKHYIDHLKNFHNIKITLIHICSHLDDTIKQAKIAKSKGQKVLHKHLNNLTARQLNKACDKEAAKHHGDKNTLPSLVLPTSINISFNHIQHTSKNLNHLHTTLQEKKLQRLFKTEIPLVKPNST